VSRGDATLTARELEVLRLLAAGGSNAEIGDRLDVRERVQAAIYAYESGLVEPGGPRHL
jgi:DNA-binding NarL/FixJ family response regulator